MRKVFNNRILLFIVAILLLANIFMVFYFLKMKNQDRRSDHGERQKSPITLFLEKDIGFDSNQLRKLDEMRQVNRRKMKPLFEDLRLAKAQFYEHLSKPGSPDSILEEAAAQIGHRQKIVDLQTFRNFTEIRTLCRPDQQPRYDSLIAGEIGKLWFPSPRERQRKEHDNKDSLRR